MVRGAGCREPNPRLRRREKNVLDIPLYRTGHSINDRLNGVPIWLRSLAHLAQYDRHIHLASTAINRDKHSVTGAMFVHNVGQVLLIADGIAVDANNEI